MHHAERPADALASPPSHDSVHNTALREFLVECLDGLDQMDQSILQLEKSPASAEPLKAIFRAMHTLKGSAGFLGLTPLEGLAHSAESLLTSVQRGRLPFHADVATALLAACDAIRNGVLLLEQTGSLEGFDVTDVTSCLDDLDAASAVQPGSNPAQSYGFDSVRSGIAKMAPAASNPRPKAAAIDENLASPAEPETAAKNDGPSLADSSIRVDVALLDKLMTRVGELVLARNQILQFTADCDDAGLTGAAQRLNLITSELQEGVMKTRMQPIGNAWTKFPRVVRDLASQLGKQVRIEMEGKDTELDKTIVEAIKDPLTHLVRNSVDHGVERPEVRVTAGKPAEGRLLLKAYHEGGQVNIEITDDGAGLNLARIRQKAVERGVVSPEEINRLSDRDVAQLIFRPGFSTAEAVTNVSGRGVGMDVVKTNIERIGGTIDLLNQPGQGMTVRIKIPLTLAIIPALVVMDGSARYAIPQISLTELVRLDGQDARDKIETVYGAPVYRLRGKLLPLVRLRDVLQCEHSQLPQNVVAQADELNEKGQNTQAVNIVVLRANDKQFGLVVDRVCDTEEIVVKPLGRQLKGVREYAGATIMGDGAVALILDVLGIAADAGLSSQSHQDAAKSTAETDSAHFARKTETLLIVDLGDSRRYALPTSAVSRLEKAPRSAIEQTDGREVIQYRDQILPLLRLTDVFGGGNAGVDEPDELTVVVYSDQGESCGFVVGHIVDIVESEITPQQRRRDSDHLLGTAVVQQRVTDIVNLPGLTRSRLQTASFA
jgi:two-component system chemotaxis sensor kinase CheA